VLEPLEPRLFLNAAAEGIGLEGFQDLDPGVDTVGMSAAIIKSVDMDGLGGTPGKGHGGSFGNLNQFDLLSSPNDNGGTLTASMPFSPDCLTPQASANAAREPYASLVMDANWVVERDNYGGITATDVVYSSDYPTLQAAEDAASSAGATLIVDKDWIVTTPIQKRSGVRWIGQGTSITAGAPFEGNMLLIASGDEDFGFSNIQFRNNTWWSLTGLYFNAGCRYVHIEGCEFVGFLLGDGVSGHALDAVDTTFLSVEGCRFTDCCGGVRVRGRLGQVEITGNTFQRMSREAVFINPTSDARHIVVRDNVAWDFVNDDSAFYLTCVETCIAENVWFVGNRADGKNIPFVQGGSADLITGKDMRNFVFSNNTARGGGDCGIAIVRSSRGVANGNICSYNTTVGISLWTCENVTATGNTCMNNQQGTVGNGIGQGVPYGGIRLERGTTQCSVTGNHCGDDQDIRTQEYGIVEFYDAHTNIIESNTCLGNALADVYRASSPTSNASPLDLSVWRSGDTAGQLLGVETRMWTP